MNHDRSEPSGTALLQQETDYYRRPEISVQELVSTLWRGRWIILSAAVLAGAVALGAALLVEKKYTATVLVSPAGEAGPGGTSGTLNSLMSQFGGLASLAGLSAGRETRTMEHVAVLQSESLTTDFIEENGLLQALFEEDWDSGRNAWKSGAAAPTLWKAGRLFRQRVRSVTTDAKTGLISVTVRWHDPTLAANWANGLVAKANVVLRERAVRDSERNTAYLTEQAAKTEEIGVRQAIFSLLQTEISQVMLAKGTNEYAFHVIDPAVVSEKPDSPRPLLWVLAGVFVGMALAMFFVIARRTWKPSAA